MPERRVFCPTGERARTTKNAGERKNGAQGRDRTTDTAIFSRMLYQLSYLGIPASPKALASGRFIERSDAPVHPASPSASLGAAPLRISAQIIGESHLFGVFGVGLLAEDDVFAG